MSNRAARAASLAITFAERSNLASRLGTALPEIELSGRVVDGELNLLAHLKKHLEDAHTQLVAAGKAGTDEAVDKALNALEAAVDEVDWDLAKDILKQAEQEANDLAEELEQNRVRIAEWESRIKAFRGELTHGKDDGVQLRDQEERMRRLVGILESAQLALRDRQYGQLRAVLPLVEKTEPALSSKERWDGEVKQLHDRIEHSRQYAAQADLLLMRSEAGKESVYSVVLRTPSRPGSHGFNIQRQSHVAEQARDALMSRITKVTKAIDSGLARRGLGPSPPGGDEPQAALDPEALLKQVGVRLYRQTMDAELRKYLEEQACSVTISTNDLEMPWELMLTNRAFMCLDRPIGRMPIRFWFPRGIDLPLIRSGRKRFLLIADPTGNLPGARAEAKAIAKALQEGELAKLVETEILVGAQATGDTLCDYLLRDDIDVIHYAGHAEFDNQHPELSALLLHGDELFRAEKIHSFLEGRPVVFLNACSSGRYSNNQPTTEYMLSGAAEGLASAFIYAGARGCVATLWRIHDDIAAAFAIAFYRRALNGDSIGQAVLHARREIKKDHIGSIMWASFVLYGDPNLTMV